MPIILNNKNIQQFHPKMGEEMSDTSLKKTYSQGAYGKVLIVT